MINIKDFSIFSFSFMFVMTSWVSFLIKPEVVPGRFGFKNVIIKCPHNVLICQDGVVSDTFLSLDKYLQQCQVSAMF